VVPTAVATSSSPSRARAMAVTSSGETAPAEPPVRRLIVKFRDGGTSALSAMNEPLSIVDLDRLTALAGQPVTFERVMSGDAFVVRLFQSLPPGQARALTDYMARDPAIEYAEPDLLLQPSLVPNDPMYVN